jgi:hypothetical protein
MLNVSFCKTAFQYFEFGIFSLPADPQALALAGGEITDAVRS